MGSACWAWATWARAAWALWRARSCCTQPPQGWTREPACQSCWMWAPTTRTCWQTLFTKWAHCPARYVPNGSAMLQGQPVLQAKGVQAQFIFQTWQARQVSILQDLIARWFLSITRKPVLECILLFCATERPILTPWFDLQLDRRWADIKAIVSPFCIVPAMTQLCPKPGVALGKDPCSMSCMLRTPWEA